MWFLLFFLRGFRKRMDGWVEVRNGGWVLLVVRDALRGEIGLFFSQYCCGVSWSYTSRLSMSLVSRKQDSLICLYVCMYETWTSLEIT